MYSDFDLLVSNGADIPSIEKCVVHGVDTFDSAFPTRIGRHGSLLKVGGKLGERDQIKSKKFADMHERYSPYLPYTVSNPSSSIETAMIESFRRYCEHSVLGLCRTSLF